MREETALLAAIRAPAEVPGLAERIARADARVTERKKLQARAEQAEEEARQSRAALPDKTQAERFRHAYSQQPRLLRCWRPRKRRPAGSQAAESSLGRDVQAAERASVTARDALAEAQRAHAAGDLAETLEPGDDCPVCLRPVTELPHHPAAAGLAKARAAVDAAVRDHQRLVRAHRDAARAAAAAPRHRRRHPARAGRGHRPPARRLR